MEVTPNPFGAEREPHETIVRRAFMALSCVIVLGAVITRDDMPAAGLVVLALTLIAPGARDGVDDEDAAPQSGDGLPGLISAAERGLPMGLGAAGLALVLGDPQRILAGPVVWLVATLGTYGWDRAVNDADGADALASGNPVPVAPPRLGA